MLKSVILYREQNPPLRSVFALALMTFLFRLISSVYSVPKRSGARIIGIAVVLSGLLMPLWASAEEAQRSRPDTINIAFIGNSISQGALLQDAATECPPNQVAQILREKGYGVNYINCAVSGYTTFHFLPTAAQADGTGSRHAFVVEAIRNLSRKRGPLFVLIMLGTNDSAERGTLGAPVSPDTYYHNLRAIIDDILTLNKKTNVIVNYPIWYSPTTHNGATYLQAGLDRLQSYQPAIDSLVAYYQSQTPYRVFAGDKSAYAFFENNTALFTAEDGRSGTFYLHPNAEGAKRLARFWAGSILKCLNEAKSDRTKQKTNLKKNEKR